MKTDVSWVGEEKIFFTTTNVVVVVFLVFLDVDVAPSPHITMKERGRTNGEIAITRCVLKRWDANYKNVCCTYWWYCKRRSLWRRNNSLNILGGKEDNGHQITELKKEKEKKKWLSGTNALTSSSILFFLIPFLSQNFEKHSRKREVDLDWKKDTP